MEPQGALVVVATPIGNLGDVSARAVAALTGADLILAEDTRRTGRLLAHLSVTTPQQAFHDHNERERTPQVVDRIAAGARVALVSDAGTPTVSDPGYRLVATCAQAGLRVELVPGPSALLHALVVSGLPTDRFTFEGFLPRRGNARRDRLAQLADERRTMVLFASPHRAAADLADLGEALGRDRPAALARELTKLHEEVRRGSLGELAQSAADGVRGEVTLVVAGAPTRSVATAQPAELVARVRELIATGLPRKDAIAAVAAATGQRRRDVYQAVVDAGA